MTEPDAIHPKVATVLAAARRHDVELEVTEHPEGARTAAEAAAAIGVDEAQIVKSLVFQVGGQMVMALVSGPNRLDETRLAEATGGGRVRRADADQVQAATGFPIGGVPPFGHATALPTFVDLDLLDHPVVWAAAGTPRHVFPVAPAELLRLSGGTPVPLAVGSERDWVRVVHHETCDECGLRPSALERSGLGDAIAAEAEAWRALLRSRSHGIEGLRDRPDPATWSALEYACHVRDSLAIFAGRVERMLAEDRPVLGWWDHDAAVVDESYSDQDPMTVASDLVTNAEHMRKVLATVPSPTGWERAGVRRSHERFTVETMAWFALHEAHHHLVDAERGLDPR